MPYITRKQLLDNISELLSFFETHIKNTNKQNLHDLSIYFEDVFCNIFNKIHSLKLINLNSVQVNSPVIDLGDQNAKICYQITAENDVAKIKNTIDGFINHNMFDTYNQLIIFILGSKKQYRTSFPTFVQIQDFNDFRVSLAPCENDILDYIYTQFEQEVSFLQNPKKNPFIEVQKNIPRLVNYHAYCKFLYDDCVEYYNEAIEDINFFISQISTLHPGLRNLIYLACMYRIIPSTYQRDTYLTHQYNEHVYFNYDALKYNGFPENDLFSFLQQLHDMNHLIYEGDLEKTCSLSFMDKGRNYDILSTIDNYCKSNSIDLKDIIYNLNFSKLD